MSNGSLTHSELVNLAHIIAAIAAFPKIHRLTKALPFEPPTHGSTDPRQTVTTSDAQKS